MDGILLELALGAAAGLLAGATIAWWVRSRQADMTAERDRLIEQKAGNISGTVLGIAALIIAGHGMFQDVNSVLMAHLILLAVIISQVCEDALRLYYYRRGF